LYVFYAGQEGVASKSKHRTHSLFVQFSLIWLWPSLLSFVKGLLCVCVERVSTAALELACLIGEVRGCAHLWR